MGAFDVSARFIRVDMDVLQCGAFQSLTPAAQITLVEFIGRYRDAVKAGFERMTFPVSRRLNLGLERKMFMRAIAELVEAGFIDRHHELGRRATYAESMRWRETIVKNSKKTGPKSGPVPKTDRF